MNAKPERSRAEGLLEEELAKVREEDDAGKQAEAMISNPALQKSLADLKADAPPDATGPFVRRVGSLREEREAQASDKAEHLIAALHTNPVARDPRARVLVGKRSPGGSAHVTAPSVVKRQELGLDAPLEVVGRSAGNTLRLAKAGGPPADAAAAEEAAPVAARRSTPWIVAVVLLLLAVPLLVIWIVQRDRALATETSASSTASNRPPASATQIADVATVAVAPLGTDAVETNTASGGVGPGQSASERTTPPSRSARPSAGIEPSTPASATTTGPKTSASPGTTAPLPRPSASGIFILED